MSTTPNSPLDEGVQTASSLIGPYGILLSLGFTLGKTLLAQFTKAKAPQEVLDGIQTMLTAIETHANDVMSKEQWEALRG